MLESQCWYRNQGNVWVAIYNNTLYQDRNTSETSRGLIDIYTNQDRSLLLFLTIQEYIITFYTKFETCCINVMDKESLNS